ncbi:hypothetical protein ACQ4M3_08090 [Leptolyngbya sp. AN03gr2]|uniref:DUF5983 family protein n=1 Tax=unclassified Leptolyngbya TaxID=2650499 RepID=UPI003D31D6E7
MTTPESETQALKIQSVLKAAKHHISQQDDSLLFGAGLNEDHPCTVCESGYEFIIWTGLNEEGLIHLDESKIIGYGHSTTFIELLKFAAAQGCHWIHLDMNNPVISALPTFDW